MTVKMSEARIVSKTLDICYKRHNSALLTYSEGFMSRPWNFFTWKMLCINLTFTFFETNT